MNDIMPMDTNMIIKAQIISLEETQHRAIREAAMGMPGAVTRLKAIDDKIVALRAQLTPGDVT